ncbi:MAG: hypothetical protein MPK62_10550, partial [Alphaproteobacteria bacterium]|nr:hypothetical protein [Alphaproteobacteria bacterium]
MCIRDRYRTNWNRQAQEVRGRRSGLFGPFTRLFSPLEDSESLPLPHRSKRLMQSTTKGEQLNGDENGKYRTFTGIDIHVAIS